MTGIYIFICTSCLPVVHIVIHISKYMLVVWIVWLTRKCRRNCETDLKMSSFMWHWIDIEFEFWHKWTLECHMRYMKSTWTCAPSVLLNHLNLQDIFEEHQIHDIHGWYRERWISSNSLFLVALDCLQSVQSKKTLLSVDPRWKARCT